MIHVEWPGRKGDFPEGTGAGEIMKDPEALAARRELARDCVDLDFPLNSDEKLSPLKFEDPAGRDIFWHSGAHLLAHAVKELFPEAKLAIGPAVEEGFYYDVDYARPFSEEDLPKIEEKMREISRRDLPIRRREMGREEARKLFLEKNESYKVEMLGEMTDEKVSVYEQDGFTDLCRGPHVPRTGLLKAVKLTKLAGAYWRGDEKNRQLSRIYGVAFPAEELLKKHLEMVAEAERRDHRKLGRDLDLFSFHEEGGPGLAYWHPKGAVVRQVIEDFWRKEHARHGYEYVFSPHIGKARLWEVSGHLDFYRDSMFAPLEIEGQKYYLKPMNCPFHILIYKSRQRSYRDLPIRYCELGTVYRYERSGTLHGMIRVRGFTQDDAHIFVRPEQMVEEVSKVLDFVLYILRTFGLSEYSVFLSTRPENSVGSDEMWEIATSSLEQVLAKAGLKYEIDEGAGVFYGPKIDINVRDSMGRLHQCSTIQVDFNLAERFDITYTGDDGTPKRAIMIHRALLGALERFFGVLIEHCAGEFPLWLAPVQAAVLTITSAQEEYARKVLARLAEAQVRTEAGLGSDKIGYKIRNAELHKIPYMLVIGKREAGEGKVAVRSRSKGDEGAVPLEEFISRITEEIGRRA